MVFGMSAKYLTTSINTMGLECLRFWRGREKNLAVVVSIPRWPDSYRQCTLDIGQPSSE
jgi:hypothetical protein